MRIALLAFALLAAVPSSAATIDSPQAMACESLATHQSIRLFFRTGDADGGERMMRQALGPGGGCRKIPAGQAVRVRERSGVFVCVETSGEHGQCVWVEAADVKP